MTSFLVFFVNSLSLYCPQAIPIKMFRIKLQVIEMIRIYILWLFAQLSRDDDISCSIAYYSPADKWNNCAFNDKRMKLGTHVKHIQQSIFGYRAISDSSGDQHGGSF